MDEIGLTGGEKHRNVSLWRVLSAYLTCKVNIFTPGPEWWPGPYTSRWQVGCGPGTMLCWPHAKTVVSASRMTSGSAQWIYCQDTRMRNIPCETRGSQLWGGGFSHQLRTTSHSRWWPDGVHPGPDCESPREGGVESPCTSFQSLPASTLLPCALTHIRAADPSGAGAGRGSWRPAGATDRATQREQRATCWQVPCRLSFLFWFLQELPGT